MRIRLGLPVVLILVAVALAGCSVYVAPPPATSPPRPAPPPPPPPPPRPPVTVDVDFFYSQLDPHGDWLWVDPYGWVWSPRYVEPFWRPYTVGRWVWTDWGWTWVSGERWGWAVYHYGRWVRVKRHGWVWVPGTVWGPAWVAWRHGGGYVGWAPLPPEVGFRAGVGIDFGGVSIDVLIRDDGWCFVDEVYIVEPDVHRRAYPTGRNATILRTTRDATRVRVVDRRIVNDGLDRREIERATKRAVPERRVVDQGSGSPREAEVIGSDVRVWRPEVRERPGAAPSRGRKPAETSAPPPPDAAKSAEQRFEKGWERDWRRLEKAQEKDAPPPKAPAPPPAADRKKTLEQHREENYRAAENAYQELQAERERAKRRSEAPREKAAPSKKTEKKDEEKKEAKEPS